MDNCKFGELIEKFVNSELTNNELKETEAHLTQCNSCQQWYQFLKKINNVQTRIRSYNPPKYLTEKIVRNIVRIQHPEKNAESRNKYNFVFFQIIPTTVIALLLVSLIIFRFNYNKTVVQPIVVNFSINATDANQVALAGDFNNWDPDSTKLVKYNNTWEIKLSLKPGRYQYIFVLDGKTYIPDPHSKEYINDGYGNKNSVLDIRKL